MRVLVLCTGNSARSQLAEAWLRHLGEGAVEASSAGSEPSRVHPDAIAVMGERGIDLSAHRSKHLDEFLETEFDYVVTVCDRAADRCPLFPGPAERLHWSYPDPAAIDDARERLEAFRAVRDDLEARIRAWLAG